VLKPPHTRRWRDLPNVSNHAKRLECGAFTAAFGRPADRVTRHRKGVNPEKKKGSTQYKVHFMVYGLGRGIAPVCGSAGRVFVEQSDVVFVGTGASAWLDAGGPAVGRARSRGLSLVCFWLWKFGKKWGNGGHAASITN
jgi:hypothetical protein